MAFRFPLATVLRLREIAESREERLLTQILHQVAEGRKTLVELGRRTKSLEHQRESALRAKTSAADLWLFEGQVNLVESLRQEATEQLVRMEELRDRQRSVYENAHRNRELLTGMREDQLNLFRQEQTRQEQKRMDDSFSSRHPKG